MNGTAPLNYGNKNKSLSMFAQSPDANAEQPHAPVDRHAFEALARGAAERFSVARPLVVQPGSGAAGVGPR
jgi:hypothetical protein